MGYRWWVEWDKVALQVIFPIRVGIDGLWDKMGLMGIVILTESYCPLRALIN